MPIVRIALVSLVAGIAVIFLAQWLREQPAVAQFMLSYPGTAPTPAETPVGIPAWVSWQHFFNAFLLVLIIRTGWIIRGKQRPPAFWTRTDHRVMQLTGRKQRLGIYHWTHLVLDAVWVLNGITYLTLLFATGQWMRVVPTSWAVVPNALSAALQYASLNWPTENPWVYYNALQQLSYFTMVFIAAPLAIITGLRLSPAWPLDGWLAKILPESPARRLHAAVMFVFASFIVLHIALVFITGALRNFNSMYAGNDSPTSWLGLWMFLLSALVTVFGWLALTPTLLKRLAAFSGDVR
ncbi:MAG: cytochrome b/b6 domain-containing protein [Microbacteriaceae bacterium]